MEITLQNQDLTVKIDTLGAQMTSVRDAGGVERIWRADPSVWGRHAPLLFPIIARLKDGRYTLAGEEYHITQHGFARDSEFAVTEQSQSEVTFRLTDSPATRKVYPCAFTLDVTYTLEGSRLTKSHTVTNRGEEEMFYELGGHDGFATTLLPGESMSDYYLELPGLTQLHPYGMDADNMITPKGPTWPLQLGGRLPLPPRVLGLDTVILDDLPQRRVTLASRTNTRRVTLEFEQFDYLGIWTQAREEDTDYICIEPWTTLPDAVFAGRGLEDKPGVRRLAPGGQETLRYATAFTL